MTRYLSFFIIFILLLVSTCFYTAAASESVLTTSAAQQEENTWQLETSEKIIKTTAKWYIINVSYPEYSLGGQSLNEFNSAISTRINSYAQNFKDMADGWELPDGAKSWLEGKYITYTANKRFITAKHSLYSDFGGASPQHEIITSTFDTQENKIITLSGLFKENSAYLERLSELSKKALFEKYPDLSFAFNTPTYQKGFAPNEKNFSNWALTDTGLVIFFPEYQVAPYAAGTLDIEIPYADIKDISLL